MTTMVALFIDEIVLVTKKLSVKWFIMLKYNGINPNIKTVNWNQLSVLKKIQPINSLGPLSVTPLRSLLSTEY